MGEDGIIEIQTGNFDRLRAKLSVFLPVARVTVAYPIPHTRQLITLDSATGEIVSSRKSPKTGGFFHAFTELYKIKSLLTHPSLSIRLMLVDVDEYREIIPKSRRNRRGVARLERVPVALFGEMIVGGEAGYVALVPDSLPDAFSSRDFAAATGLRLYEAQRALNVLAFTGAVQEAGKSGRMKLYGNAVSASIVCDNS